MSVELVIAERFREELLACEVEAVAGEGFEFFGGDHGDVVLVQVGEVPAAGIAHELWVGVGVGTEDG